MKNIVLLAILSAAVIAACRPAKKIQTAVSKKDTSAVVSITNPAVDSAALKESIMARVNSNHIDFRFFSSKIKVDYTDATGKTTDVTAFVRIKKDSIIWLSLTGLLGVEGFRVLVRPDTVVIMNKLEKTISYKTVAYLREMIKLPVDFYTLQDLLVGNPIFFPDNIVSFRNSNNTLLALSVGDYFKHLITLDTADNRILHTKLDDVQPLRNRTCDITLSDYNRQQGRLFSNNREITVTEKAKLGIKMDFKQVTFDEAQSFPFNIPKNYSHQ